VVRETLTDSVELVSTVEAKVDPPVASENTETVPEASFGT
jgi:hypothetical protein